MLVPGKWEAIVTAENWHATRALLTDPARRTSRPGRDKHLCSMIATCAACGGPLSVRYRRGISEYTCRNGGHVRAPQDELDGLVERLTLGRLREAGRLPRGHRPDTSAEVQAAQDDLEACGRTTSPWWTS